MKVDRREVVTMRILLNRYIQMLVVAGMMLSLMVTPSFAESTEDVLANQGEGDVGLVTAESVSDEVLDAQEENDGSQDEIVDIQEGEQVDFGFTGTDRWVRRFTAQQAGLYEFSETYTFDWKNIPFELYDDAGLTHNLYGDDYIDIEDSTDDEYKGYWGDTHTAIRVRYMEPGQTVYLSVRGWEAGSRVEGFVSVSLMGVQSRSFENMRFELGRDAYFVIPEPITFNESVFGTNDRLVDPQYYEIVWYQMVEGQYVELNGVPLDAGTYYVVARSKQDLEGGYTGETQKIAVNIRNSLNISDGIWTHVFNDSGNMFCVVNFDGGRVIPIPEHVLYRNVFQDGGYQREELVEGEEYELDYIYDANEKKRVDALTLAHFYDVYYKGINNHFGRVHFLIEVRADKYDLAAGVFELYREAYVVGDRKEDLDYAIIDSETYYIAGTHENKLTDLVFYTADGEPLAGQEFPQEAGTYYVAARGVDGGQYYNETPKVMFRIRPVGDLGNGKWTASFENEMIRYTGEEVQLPSPAIYRHNDAENKDEYLSEGDFALDHYEDRSGGLIGEPVDVGGYYAVYRGVGAYEGLIRASFSIVEARDMAMASISAAAQCYTGFAIEPSVTIRYAGELLVKDRDYTVSFDNNVNAGTAKIIVEGKGIYVGTKESEFVISKAAQKITLGATSYDKAYGDSKFALNAVISVGDGELSYTTSDDNVVKVSNGVVSIVGAGTATVAVVASETTNYKERSIVTTINVAKAASTISLADQTATYTGKALAYTGKVTKTGSAGAVTYAYYSDSACKKSVKAADVKGAGAYYVRATLASDANHKAATSAAAKLTVAKATSSIKLADQTKTYTGKALAYSGKVTRTGSAGKVTYAYYSDAKCTKSVAAADVKAAGTYYVKATVAADDNYERAKSDAAKLTVAKAASSIKLVDQTKTYTGQTLAYTGKVTKSGSSGKVTYAYYSDAACTKAVKAADVKAAGTYYARATLASDANHDAATSDAAKLTVAKASNPLAVKAVARTASAKKLKSKAVTVARPLSVSKAQGKVTYAKVAKGSSAALTVNKKTGKVTVKKGTKVGKYTIKIKVNAAGNVNCKSGSKNVACKVIVK